MTEEVDTARATELNQLEESISLIRHFVTNPRDWPQSALAVQSIVSNGYLYRAMELVVDFIRENLSKGKDLFETLIEYNHVGEKSEFCAQMLFVEIACRDKRGHDQETSNQKVSAEQQSETQPQESYALRLFNALSAENQKILLEELISKDLKDMAEWQSSGSQRPKCTLSEILMLSDITTNSSLAEKVLSTWKMVAASSPDAAMRMVAVCDSMPNPAPALKRARQRVVKACLPSRSQRKKVNFLWGIAIFSGLVLAIAALIALEIISVGTATPIVGPALAVLSTSAKAFISTAAAVSIGCGYMARELNHSYLVDMEKKAVIEHNTRRLAIHTKEHLLKQLLERSAQDPSLAKDFFTANFEDKAKEFLSRLGREYCYRDLETLRTIRKSSLRELIHLDPSLRDALLMEPPANAFVAEVSKEKATEVNQIKLSIQRLQEISLFLKNELAKEIEVLSDTKQIQLNALNELRSGANQSVFEDLKAWIPFLVKNDAAGIRKLGDVKSEAIPSSLRNSVLYGLADDVLKIKNTLQQKFSHEYTELLREIDLTNGIPDGVPLVFYCIGLEKLRIEQGQLKPLIPINPEPVMPASGPDVKTQKGSPFPGQSVTPPLVDTSSSLFHHPPTDPEVSQTVSRPFKPRESLKDL